MAKLTPTEKKKVRELLAGFMRRAEEREERWHYTQQRPYTGLNVSPELPHANDCSSYVALAFHWAMHWTKVYLDDPLGEHYSGWGYTGSLETWLRKHGKPVPATNRCLVGDIALYTRSSNHAHHHTTICRVAGSRTTAIFSSNGSEAGPLPTKLGYRSDLTGVWRHPALL